MLNFTCPELGRSVFRRARNSYITRPWGLTMGPLGLSRLFESVSIRGEKRLAAGPATITLNTTVTVLDLQEHQLCDLTLVLPAKAQPEKGRISFLSLLGSELMGKQLDALVSVDFFGTRMRFKVVRIRQQASRKTDLSEQK